MGADDNEVVMMSFEERKTRMKQFKQGTDFSHILINIQTRTYLLAHSLRE